MAIFRFNLQKVLDVRKHKEDIIKNELMVVNAKKIMEEQKKKSLQDEYRRHIKLLKSKKKEMGAEELKSYNNYFNRLNYEVKKQNLEIERWQLEVDKVKRKLVLVTQEKRVIERLKERRYKEYVADLRAEEQNFLDEVGTIKSARRKITGINGYMELGG